MELAYFWSFLAIGFFAKSRTAYKNCDRNFTSPFGEISSPSFPSSPFPYDIECKYRITAPTGERIQITFLSHPHLSDTNYCYQGDLRIFEGEFPNVASDSPSEQFCNSRRMCHKEYYSKENSLLLAYANRDTYVPFMFTLVYRFMTEISSPSFPSSPFPYDIECKYRITAPTGERIQITFLSHPHLSDTNYCYQGDLRIFEGEFPNVASDSPSEQFCNSRRMCHKEYYSKENSLLLAYANRDTYVPFMFTLVYRFMTGFNMVYNNTEGVLYSPNFMNKQLNISQTYTYRIEADTGLRVYLAFSYINFYQDTNCSVTSLSIYDGTNANGIPTARRCGRNSTEFLSVSNVVTLEYITSANTSSLPADHGFIIFYASGTQKCNNLHTTSSGTIYSPLYPRSYPNNTICTYNITVQNDEMIYLAARSVSLSYGDTLEVFERDPTSGFLTRRTEVTATAAYYSNSNSLVIKFKSNSIYTEDGFVLEYRATKGCNIKFTSRHAYISSPLYPFNYPNNIICSYTFTYQPSIYQFPAFTLTKFDIEDSETCEADSLSVYDGSNTSALLLDTLCGIKSRRTYLTSGNTLFVQFRTNNRTSKRGFRGTFMQHYSYCSKEYRHSDSIFSPNHPYKYPHNVSCQYHIASPSGSTIAFKFHHFDLETSKSCNKDSLRIYDRSISEETLMSTRCGNDSTEFISRSNLIYLLFTSDSTIAGTGYRIDFTTCGGKYYHYFGQYSIKSPWYPESYPRDSICRYDLHGRDFEFSVRLVFNTFDLEDSQRCRNDNFTIYEERISNATVADIKCGQVTGDFFSKSQNLIIVFKSNSMINSKGFSIDVDSCSKLFTNETGTITSPGFPSRQPQGSLCTYAIRLQKGIRIQIAFQNFSLGGHHIKDQFKVYDGRDSSARLVAIMTDSNYQNVLASGNEVFIELITTWYPSDDSRWYGFELNYIGYQGFCSKHSPCENNATCVDLLGDFICKCSIEYKGRNCSELIVPCKSNPCLNDSVCSNIYSNEPPDYRCTYINGSKCEHILGCTTQDKKATRNIALMISLCLGSVILFALAIIITTACWKRRAAARPPQVEQPFMAAVTFENEAYDFHQT